MHFSSLPHEPLSQHDHAPQTNTHHTLPQVLIVEATKSANVFAASPPYSLLLTDVVTSPNIPSIPLHPFFPYTHNSLLTHRLHHCDNYISILSSLTLHQTNREKPIPKKNQRNWEGRGGFTQPDYISPSLPTAQE